MGFATGASRIVPGILAGSLVLRPIALVDRNRPVHRRSMHNRRPAAELDALLVVIPGLARLGAHARTAMKRAVSVRFNHYAGLITLRNANRQWAVLRVRLQTR